MSALDEAMRILDQAAQIPAGDEHSQALVDMVNRALAIVDDAGQIGYSSVYRREREIWEGWRRRTTLVRAVRGVESLRGDLCLATQRCMEIASPGDPTPPSSPGWAT